MTRKRSLGRASLHQIPSPKAPLQVDYLPISALKPDPRNPRRHSPDQITALARTFGALGFNVPVLIDRDLKILAGHGRALAAQHLGLSEVATIRLEHLNEAQARAFAIADNRLTDLSDWDERLLAENLKELNELVIDFEIEVTGFEVAEIDLRIAQLDEVPDFRECDPADEIPELKGPCVTRLGDLWLLGEHRILCGDALDPGAYEMLFDGCGKATAVITDPPYNLPIRGHVSGLGAVTHREFAMGSGEMTGPQHTQFLSAAFRLFADHSANGSLHFVFMDWRHLREIQDAGGANYSELKNVCVWVKSNPGMGSLYRSQHEFIFVFKNGEAPHRNNVRLGKYGRSRSNVWMYPSANAFVRENGERLLDLHPTVKPVALIADAILDCTARGDIVLDGFLGSGTGVLAAERTGRRCFGIEIDPIYVDTAIMRWERMTDREARLESDGRAFAEIAAERAREAGHDR
jgi:DNA modification methylase